jgi:hypothetical protein
VGYDPKQPKPIITKDLIDYLSYLYPDRCPEPNDSDRSIWRARGAVDVVRHLIEVQKQQENNILLRN